ncbi:MAG: ATPases involved in chromosome partitioning [Phormidesmis priestleyi Ana]|uniref:ATPases involved in chromosome partitioning n=1 Tax=Phormidesmis priestleyi Ana TaxID=1666911 RepID=A0A0N8KMF9_9CYAN|nr:MAG: ATPases involved in chromosome partitioning [Phormidesmis priestleyi Ana]
MEPSQTPSFPADFTTNNVRPIPAVFAPEQSSVLAAWQQHAQQEEEGDLRNLLLVARRRAWVIAGVAVAVMSFVTVRSLQEVKVYQGSFRMLVEPVNAEGDLSELTASLSERQVGRSGLDYETQIQVLRSPELAEPVAQEIQQKYPDLTYFSLLRDLSITRVGETKIIQVSYTGPDPVQIQFVLDQLAEAYLEYSLAERQTNLRQGINFVEKQLPELQTQVDALQGELESFRRGNNFITPEAQSGLVSGKISQLSEQRAELQRQLAEAQQFFNTLQGENGVLAALDGAPIYQQLLGELRSVETDIAKELTRFEPDSLAITVLEEQRENLLPLLQQEAQRVVGTKQAIAANNLQVLSVQSNALAQEEQTAAQLGGELPSLIRRYTDLQRELEEAVQTLSRFRLTRETLEIEAAQTEIPWQLIEVPTLPTAPISPNLQRSLLLGFVASLLLGLGAALLLEKLDNVYHSVDELKAGTKLPLLGTLPMNAILRDNQAKRKGLFSEISNNLANLKLNKRSRSAYYGYGGNSESSFLEALRVLHTNIRMLSSDKPIRSILISSAQPGEGKSTVAANLAQVATAMGQRVLVVDVDLRKPQVHDRLDLPNKMGLSNLIADNLPLKSVLKQVRPDGQLFALTSGKVPPDPTKLLSSQRMKQLMATFAASFDLVIYDAPPTTGLADVSLLGQYTDGLVLISRMGKTDRMVLKQTIETLKLAQIPVLGIVANGVSSTGIGGYRYYAYGYAERDEEEITEVGIAPGNGRNGNGRDGNEQNGNGRNGNDFLF